MRRYFETLDYGGVFEVIKDKRNNTYRLEEKQTKYFVPERLYGDMDKYVDFYWKSFNRLEFISGLILMGQKGSGKTMISASLCNLCIGVGMRVIEVTNVAFTPDLIRFLSDLDNVVLFFDEFGKNFSISDQDKMLTSLSGISGLKRIILITENNKFRVSEFIRGRPGRVKYSMYFNRLPIKVIDEYCKEFSVDEVFYKDFIDAYKSLTEFQFDHLMAIVDEHIHNRDMKFDDLVELLNIEGITGVKSLVLLDAIDIKDKFNYNVMKVNPTNMALDEFEKRGTSYITLGKPTKEGEVPNAFRDTINIYISKSDLIEMTDDMAICEKDGVRLIFKLERV